MERGEANVLDGIGGCPASRALLQSKLTFPPDISRRRPEVGRVVPFVSWNLHHLWRGDLVPALGLAVLDHLGL
jgi:hypothetical protein